MSVKKRCPRPAPGQPGCVPKCGHRWSYVLELARADDGRRRQEMKSGFATKKDAEAALAEARVRANRGEHVAPDRQTVAAYLPTWLDGLSRKPATMEAYRRVVERHLIPGLGRHRLQQLTPPHLKAFYRALQDDKGLSPSTVQLVHQVLSKALSDAVHDGLVVANVAAKVKAPARSTPEMQTWDRKQARGFLEHVDGERLSAMWRLFLTTGMRRGEVAALRWQDLDLDRASLAVRQTGNMLGKVWTVGTPKGRGDATAKTRRLALDPGTVEALHRHRAGQLEERLAWGGDWRDFGLVFVRGDGSPLNPSTIGQQLTVRAKQAGLPHIRVHDLRHTYATLALEAGVHLKVVSERLGHANIGITLNLYSHVSEGMDRAAADLLARLFS